MAEGKGRQSKFDVIVGAVDRLSAPFKRMNDAIAQKTAGIRRLGESVKSLNRETGLAKLGGSLANVRDRMGGIGTEAKNLADRVTGMAGRLSLLFGATGGGLFALAHSTAAAGDAAAKAGQRAGVSTKAWQEYAHAASLCDVNSEQLEKAFQKLTEQSVKAAQGGKAQAQAWKDAGIKVKDSQGKIKHSTTLLSELADKVQALNAAGQQGKALNLVKGIMGEEGAKLLPMLASGAKGIADMRAEAHKLGIVLSDADAAASEEFNDSLTRGQAALKGMGYIIGREILPVATDLIKRFTDWAVANRELIQTKVREWAEKFSKILPKIGEGLLKVGGAVTKAIAWADTMAQKFGGWENVLIGVAGIMGGKLVWSIGLAAKAVLGLGATIMTTPVGWILGACAAIGTAAYAVYKNWEGIKTYFANLWGEVREAFSRNWLEGVVKYLINFNPLRLLGKGLMELWKFFDSEFFNGAGAALMGRIWDGIKATWEDVMAWFREVYNDFVSMIPESARKFAGIELAASPEKKAAPTEAARSFAGAPLQLGGAARQMSETRTVHVERQEGVFRLLPPEGFGLQQVGGSAGMASVDSSGQGLMMAYGL